MIINVRAPVNTTVWQVACLNCQRKYGILTLEGDDHKPDRCSFCGHLVVAFPHEVRSGE